MCVSVLIPAFNEERRIKTTIETVFKLKEIEEVIVIDDGSTDATYQQAMQTKAKVIQLLSNQGKGAALNQGLNQINGKVILLLDADIGKSAVEAEKLLTPVLEGRADMTVAQFPEPEKKGGFGLAKNLAKWGLKKITGRSFAAPLSGQRAFTSQVLKRINSFAPGFGVEVSLTIAVYQAGFMIEEIPVEMEHRVTGRTWKGFLHRGRQFKDIIFVLTAAIKGVK